MRREAGYSAVVESLLLLTCSAPFPNIPALRPQRSGEQGRERPLVGLLTHSRSLADTHREVLTCQSHRGPVGPAHDLLHDVLIGQPGCRTALPKDLGVGQKEMRPFPPSTSPHGYLAPSLSHTWNLAGDMEIKTSLCRQHTDSDDPAT